MSDPKYRAKAVRSPRGGAKTEIDWADGHKSVYPHEVLRGYCPCAGCQGHTGTISFVRASGLALEIEEFLPVGSYALQIQWADGHDSGLYSYTYLRSLCQCPECKSSIGVDEHQPVPRK